MLPQRRFHVMWKVKKNMESAALPVVERLRFAFHANLVAISGQRIPLYWNVLSSSLRQTTNAAILNAFA